jgi:hypothetical protein
MGSDDAQDEDDDDDGIYCLLSFTASYHDSNVGDDYMDYDSDYDTKDDAAKGVTDVDPYSGTYRA